MSAITLSPTRRVSLDLRTLRGALQRRLRQLAPVLTLALTLSACGSCLGPKAEQLNSPVVADLKEGMKANGETFDHSTWDALLKKHVDAKTKRVDYAGFKQDQAKLKSYLKSIASAPLKQLSRSEQKALLINAYNAYTIQLIIENYPGLKSIKDIDEPWDTKRYKVGGHTLSLNDIEHGLLRPVYKDPRIHFAVNCASIGCPPLAAWAYTGKRLDKQLEQVTRKFTRDKDYVRIKDGTLMVSSILKWYGEDFTKKDYKPRAKTVPAFLARYADKKVKVFIKKHDDEPPVDYLNYDWSLNDDS